ncbi:L-arginine-specific L-amino acid ligase [Dickeya dianthicola]|uniref:ATP-grasp domain-containing protein n=1 Tax=Dickeya dianthicola TaxID=204039 RepID=A0ABX9NR79_9GAMM|nr:ATP-grasp domain-containing protein [Dickeya dianthicola]AYC18352.1 L-arginine-specific L-amino acid ligase [Dickeya dianthicola]MBI0439979.1 ATP-grasp domain-containing protein [Dickeya dianthicola]MBI0450717.1 ATP-grasp domain-containing protein [Dickeya dianthicola]MBI0455292.1 ATP-grasp domain-containing protein [Dickeya dianthicola]MBI0459546.1 ATP-grasp domain-containing protein [Dickeya dianthicola]
MTVRKIIMVGSQDEIFEELPPEDIELYVIQPSALIGPRLRAAAKDIYAIDAFNDEQVLAGARYFCGRHAIDGLFSFTEYGLLPAANAAKALALPGISAEITELCRNKWKLREKLAATSLHVPFVMFDNHAALTQFAGENGFPLVLKDPCGVGSINVKICHSLAEALAFFDELQQQGYACVLAEKYVEGTEYSVETLSIRGCHQLIGVTDKYLLPGGVVEHKHVYPAYLTVEARAGIERYICRLLEQIQHRHGPMHIEVKVDGEQIYLIEINNRPGGDYIWDMVNKVSGVNLVAETLKYAFSGQPDAEERKARRRYGAMSYIALFKPIPTSTIRQALDNMAVLDRVQCQIFSQSSKREIRNSFERPGFVLIGEKNVAALCAALPSIETWIESQSHQQGE